MKPSYTFIIRKARGKDSYELPVYLRVIYNRKKSLYYTGIRIDEKYWNSDKSEVRRSHSSSDVYNDELYQLRMKAERIGFDLDRQKTISAKAIIHQLKGASPYNFFEYAENYSERLKKSGSIRRSKQNQVVINKLKSKVGSKVLEFNEITPSFLEDFEVYLKTEYGNAQNTIVKDLERLRMVFADALKNEVIDMNPFERYKMPSRQSSKKEAITYKQIQDIEGLSLETGSHLFHCRNYFLFSFYNAGIRFGDICKLKWDNIKDGRLKYLMGKSTHTTNPKWKDMKLNQKSLDILGYYIKTNHDSQYIFPIFDSSKDYSDPELFDKYKSRMNTPINKGLKEIGKKAGIDTHITFHISRHSFARHAATEGMNVYALSNALAHSNLKTTQIYLKDFDENLLDKEMENLF